MKVKVFIILLFVSFGFLGSCVSSQPQQDSQPKEDSQPKQESASARPEVQIFDTGAGSICIIKNDLLHIFSYSNTEGWQKYPGENLQLPKGYSDVFFLDAMMIGVNINNTIHVYEIDDGQMIKSDEDVYPLPSGGYKEVVGLGGVMGIVRGNVLEFCYVSGEKMEDIPAFTLPQGYGKIFWAGLGGDYIGIVVDGEVRFYDMEEGYQEITELRLKLPAGYTDVFCFDEQYMGIYVDNVLRFFEYAGFWRGIPNASLEALM